jgi:hypothetical protein
MTENDHYKQRKQNEQSDICVSILVLSIYIGSIYILWSNL